MLELKLNVTPGSWQKFMARRLSVSFKRIAAKIHQRDRFTCQYCGFQAKEYMDVINHDNDYTNNKASNLVTACCFCSQCVFLESVGLDNMSGGQVVYLPEISQNDINSLCHVMFCAMGGESQYQDTAQITYRSLKLRSQLVEKIFGEGTSDPRMLGRLVLEYQAQNQCSVPAEVLSGLRLLPTYTKFHVQLATWAQTAVTEKGT